jgi:hypothetical protein
VWAQIAWDELTTESRRVKRSDNREVVPAPSQWVDGSEKREREADRLSRQCVAESEVVGKGVSRGVRCVGPSASPCNFGKRRSSEEKFATEGNKYPSHSL